MASIIEMYEKSAPKTSNANVKGRDKTQIEPDGGLNLACFNLGNSYFNGEGVRLDKFKALELFKKVCDANDPQGCVNLGLLYDKGDGIRLDKSKALELFGKACDLKEELGCKYYADLKNEGIR